MIKRLLFAASLAFFLSFTTASGAQIRFLSQDPAVHGNVITVSRSGNAYAQPDLGILTMAIRSYDTRVEDAITDNVQKTKAVEAALAALGYSQNQYKITSVTFRQPGPARPYVQPDQPPSMGYEVSQSVYVFFEGSELKNVAQLSENEAAAIEALRKAGAVPSRPRLAGPSRNFPQRGQVAMVVYTIKDSESYEKDALQQALRRARQAAHNVASTMQVRLVKLESVRSGYLARAYPLTNGLAPLAGLPYRFYSTNSNEVQITASATLIYRFK